MARDRVAGLVDRNRASLERDVLGADRGAGVEGRDGLDEIVPRECRAAGVVRDGQRHRGRLLDHRRGVPAHDPRDLVAPLRQVELRVVRDLADVELEDVEPVVLGRCPEPDVTAHATRADERRIEPVDRDVRRADEVDLVFPRACGRQPKPHVAEPARDDEARVEHRVQLARERPAHPRRVVDPVHDDEKLVEGEPAAAHSAHAAGEHEVVELTEPRIHAARHAVGRPVRAARTAGRATPVSRRSGRRRGHVSPTGRRRESPRRSRRSSAE